MHHVMFDVDGTLVQSYELDETCFVTAVSDVLGSNLDTNWAGYQHVTDTGILKEHLQRQKIVQDHDEIHREVKNSFINKVVAHLSDKPATEIPGAKAFIAKLKGLDSVSLSIATGGWGESAKLKLESAGFDISGIPIASSNDHYSRIEIMTLAHKRAKIKQRHRITYFGDAAWDQSACKELGFDFVLVGNRIEHDQVIDDFTNVKQVLSLIGI